MEVEARPSDAVARRAAMRQAQEEGERRHRRRASVAALVVMALGVLGPVVGAFNPWNLLVVDQVFDHPALGGLVVVAGGLWLWALNVSRPRALRVGGSVGLGLAGVAVVITAVVMAMARPNIMDSSSYASSFSDAEVRITKARYDGGPEIWEIWLAADRGGLASRENQVAVLGLVDYGTHPKAEVVPVSVDTKFQSADRLEVSVDGQLVYRLDFDPHDLHVVRETCSPVPAPSSWDATFGCVGDLSEWQF